ncbi:MAG: FAD:protein FMN transferase [Solobacterium sp.]|nr:FAD:protein FMN transferase [Solobacterium sp.]
MRKLFIVGLVSCLLGGCTTPNTPAPTPEVTLKSNTCIDCGFDTFFSLRGFPLEQDEFDQIFQTSSALFKKYNDLFDIYYDHENVNSLRVINQNAGKEAVKVEPEIIEMLKKAKEFYDLSNGEFDITMGALLKIWHEYRTEGILLNEDGEYGHLPPQEKLEDAAQYRGWEYIEIDEEKSTVYITDEHVSLDVGGIAKGFAAEQIALYLEKEGYHTGAVNAGGNNRTLGPKPDGTPWRVGIQDPKSPDSIVVVEYEGIGSFVTSGDYERNYIAEDEQHYHHIIDPSTLYPARHWHSVSVFTTNSTAADCITTTLFTLSYEDGIEFIKKYKAVHPDETLEAVWITDTDKKINSTHTFTKDDQLIIYTEGLDNRITLK